MTPKAPKTPADRMASVKALTALATKGAAHRFWYDDGVPVVLDVAAALEIDPSALADVIALTSPRVQVRRNMVLALRYLLNRKAFATLDKTALQVALRVIPSTAAALVHWEATGKIRGKKTEAFARAVLGDPTALVLDVWMARALGVPQERIFRKANHAKATKRVTAVARRLGWTVAQTQAAIWAGAIDGHVDSRGRRAYLDAPPLGALLRDAHRV